jgi:bacillithiol biosynthesis cysteine-adding enzyme BshC
MKTEYYDRKKFNTYNRQQILLSENQSLLKDFIGLPFDENSFVEQIRLKKNNYSSEFRAILQNSIRNSYKNIDINDTVSENINLLGDQNTFTITCGHQLTLFGGPAYFFYKIIHIISLTKKLNERYKQFRFVPVFWMASEDHDKDEITKLNIFNNHFVWETESEGPTGNYKLDSNFEKIKSDFIQFFSNSEFDEINDHLNNFKGANLSEGFISYLNSIFKDYGLIILEPNSRELKKLFIPIIKKEIEQFQTFKCVSKSNTELEEFGFTLQAKIQPINLFYLQDDKRIRIKFENNLFSVEDNFFTLDELLKHVENYPERFSPNVFLRPIFQELILPNIAFIGGPSEINYWLQLKKLFQVFTIPFPLIQPRLSVIYVDKSMNKKIKKINFQVYDYFNEDIFYLKKRYMQQTEEIENLDWNQIDSSLENIKNNYLDIYKKNASEIIKTFEAEWNNIEKSIAKIKNKLEKRIMERHEQEINSLEQLKNKFLPNNNPQERFYHFFHFCSQGNLKLVDEMIEVFNPFENRIMVIYED